MIAEEALAQFAAAQVVVPVEVQEMCLVGLSDSLGGGVGGLAAESAVITRSLLAEADSGGTHVWASSQRLPPRDAAWLLGPPRRVRRSPACTLTASGAPKRVPIALRRPKGATKAARVTP